MGRPRVYSGTVIGVKLPGILEIKIRAEAQAKNKSISEIVRAKLERSYRQGNEDKKAD